MRSRFFALLAALCLSLPALAEESVKEQVKEAGRTVGRETKKAAQAVGREAKKAAQTVGQESKKAYQEARKAISGENK